MGTRRPKVIPGPIPPEFSISPPSFPVDSPVTKLFVCEPSYGHAGDLRDSDPFGAYVLQSKAGEASFIQQRRAMPPMVEGFHTRAEIEQTLLLFLLNIAGHARRLLTTSRVEAERLVSPGDRSFKPTPNTLLSVDEVHQEDFGFLMYTNRMNFAIGCFVHAPWHIRAARIVNDLFPRSESVPSVA